MSIVSTDDAESFIKIWMNDRGYSADELKPEGLAFQLDGKFETGVTFSIIQPLTLKRAVVVVAQIDFPSISFGSNKISEIRRSR